MTRSGEPKGQADAAARTRRTPRGRRLRGHENAKRKQNARWRRSQRRRCERPFGKRDRGVARTRRVLADGHQADARATMKITKRTQNQNWEPIVNQCDPNFGGDFAGKTNPNFSRRRSQKCRYRASPASPASPGTERIRAYPSECVWPAGRRPRIAVIVPGRNGNNRMYDMELRAESRKADESQPVKPGKSR